MIDLKTTWNTLNHKDVWMKAYRTGLAAFIITFSAGLTNVLSFFIKQDVDSAKKALGALILASGAAAATAVYHYYKQLSTPQITPPST